MREKQTTCQNQLAEGDVGNTHTLTYTHSHRHTHSLSHTHLLDTSKGVAGESPRKQRYSTSPSPSQYSCSSLTCHPAATARKMNHKCLVVIVIRNQPRRSRKVRKQRTRLFGLSTPNRHAPVVRGASRGTCQVPGQTAVRSLSPG